MQNLMLSCYNSCFKTLLKSLVENINFSHIEELRFSNITHDDDDELETKIDIEVKKQAEIERTNIVKAFKKGLPPPP